MIRNKIIFFLSFLFVLSFSFILIAGDFQPGTPSSSYNFNYNGEFKYVMTESDFDYKNFCKMEILRN